MHSVVDISPIKNERALILKIIRIIYNLASSDGMRNIVSSSMSVAKSFWIGIATWGNSKCSCEIDKTLLKGKGVYNKGRLLPADTTPNTEDRQKWIKIHEGVEASVSRNHRMRIEWPRIFGLSECIKKPDGNYKTGEVRLFHVEKINKVQQFGVKNDPFTDR
ncbi:hypothetical protein RF11_08569 [Thelohanellus kitauei]|uniref:Uncharacterized protein n=1 Tax=Thelohanellus kitauei TaxID=669202 RepID=A0A0C2IXT2_THEKT|nr:hypothetical protein RF11_08569 [Thelohanellus kitauei]